MNSLKSVQKTLADRFGKNLKCLILYGSWAKGTARRDSDIDLLVASKHAIQAVLAMKGKGYSSKVAVLLSLAEKYFGKEIAEPFRKLFDLYIKTEYGIEFLTEEEARKAVEYAREVQKIYLEGRR